MSEMYKRIEDLCKAKGINMTAMCRDTNIPRGNLTDLKMGRTAELSTKTLSKISSYFDVPMEHLLGKEDIKKAPTPEGERDELKEKVFRALETADPAIREAALRLLGVQE